jgi:N-methylhydantoinase A
MYSIGIDIGGTFTDFTVYDRRTGAISVEKRLSTPNDPATAVLTGLESLARRIAGLEARCERINHATTLVTNAILERKGAKVALLGTEGFRDILEQRLEARYNVYDLFIRFPDPIVPRHLRYGVRERVFGDGGIGQPLDETQVSEIARALEVAEVGSVAICFLHAYRNPAHERLAAEILTTRLPRVSVSVSHEVDPEPREYERTSTTVLDAYVKPIVGQYVTEVEQGLVERGFEQGLEIMLSNGTSTTAGNARRYPIQIIESGPAAGVEAAIWMCRHLGIPNALSFDMGGTTAKLCVISDYAAGRSRKFEAGRVHRFAAGSGLPVSVPVYDLVEIGAGGGSIARVDGLGLISVGPDSAGAEPGPACYARGGTLPTVTDADLLLGLIDPDYFLGGAMRLDAHAAEQAMESVVARPLGLSAVAAAHGVFDIVNETMASAARLHIAEKGCDPTRLTVIAFGGAGPLHATDLARKLGCPRVVFPPYAGVMSSFGLLTAPPAFERMATVKRLIRGLGADDIAAVLSRLEVEVARIIGHGDGSDIAYRYVAEMWHHGQEFPIEVPFDHEDLGSALPALLTARFTERYRALYGRVDDETPVELVNVRVIGGRSQRRVDVIRPFGADRVRAATRLLGRRRVYEPREKTFLETPVLDRAALRPGEEIAGPAVVQERESGILLRRGDRLRVHESGAVFVDLA